MTRNYSIELWHKERKRDGAWIAALLCAVLAVAVIASVWRICAAIERSSTAIALGISNAARAERTVRHIIVIETAEKGAAEERKVAL